MAFKQRAIVENSPIHVSTSLNPLETRRVALLGIPFLSSRIVRLTSSTSIFYLVHSSPSTAYACSHILVSKRLRDPYETMTSSAYHHAAYDNVNASSSDVYRCPSLSKVVGLA